MAALQLTSGGGMRLRQNEGRAASDVNPTLQLTWPDGPLGPVLKLLEILFAMHSVRLATLSGEFPLQAVYKGSRASR